MKSRFRLIRRGVRGGTFYCIDSRTGKRTSLQTDDEGAALQIVNAKNQAERQPHLNLQLAKAYLAGSDSGMTTRTWTNAFTALIETKSGANRHRWETAAKDRAFDVIRNRVLVETEATHFLKVLKQGTVSTNVFLRRLHNFCVDMNWLLRPILPKRQWPAVRHKDKRAITAEEHERIVEREQNPERKAFYQLAWHLGASQTDLANLHAEDVDTANRVISLPR